MKAIQPNELRIGNYYQDNYNNYRMIKELSSSLFSDEIYSMGTPTISMFPIPLTEEILIKAGFDHESFSFYLYKDFIVRKIRESDKQWRVIFRHKDLKDIEYLHELQNLIFALTGEEIKIDVE